MAWALPTLFGVVVGVYFLSTLLPLAKVQEQDLSVLQLRALPRFVNAHPDDVRQRVRRALDDIASGSARAETELAALGSAAWPTIMQRWPDLDSQTRERTARAFLSGSRLLSESTAGGPRPTRASDATQLELLWGDRSMDFTEVSRMRALQRLLDHPSAERELDYVSLGTYGLEPVFDRLQRTDRRDAWMALTRVASKVVGTEDSIKETDDAVATSACIARWRQWWLVNEAHFSTRSALLRPLATFTETGFGKRLGSIYIALATSRATGDNAALSELADSAAITLSLVLGAVCISYLLASLYAAISHAREARQAVRWSNRTLTLLLALPAIVVARALASFAPGTAGMLTAPMLVMVAASLPNIARQERAALTDAIRSDYLRTARAKGASERRVLVIHALRTTLGPALVWAGAEVPGLLGVALVVEELWNIHGLGWHTVRAVELHNETSLMANALLMGAVAVFATVLADLVNALVDPRARNRITETSAP